MDGLIRLRELPGVSRVADLCRNGQNFDYLKRGYTMEEIDNISIQLFCITQYDTYTDEDDPAEEAEYEEQFHVISLPWPQGKPFWSAVGWDICDEAGHELICAHFFQRQIIAVTRDLVEGARLCLDGSGTHAYDDFESDLSDSSLAENLEKQVAAFLAKKRTGGR